MATEWANCVSDLLDDHPDDARDLVKIAHSVGVESDNLVIMVVEHRKRSRGARVNSRRMNALAALDVQEIPH